LALPALPQETIPAGAARRAGSVLARDYSQQVAQRSDRARVLLAFELVVVS
jgi:hypothetical protein